MDKAAATPNHCAIAPYGLLQASSTGFAIAMAGSLVWDNEAMSINK
jgi:hypothetical protein